jgi:outer membrane protein assembly factor BamB
MRVLQRRWRCPGTWLGVVLIAGWWAAPGRADDWPQWLGPERDGVWRETGLLERFPAGGPKVVWRVPLGTGYSGPAVAGDRVYVMDRLRPVDASGKPKPPTRDGIPGTERLLCLAAADGKVLWKDEYDCPYTISYGTGPRTTPVIRDGRVYALGAMGDLRCLDAATGKPIWTKKLLKEYGLEAPQAWGWAAHPVLEGDLLYVLVGGKGSAVVAFHKDTGKEAWRALTTVEPGYSPPILIRAGGKWQLVVWLSESINGLNPETGEVYWTQRYPVGREPQRPAVNISTVRKDGDLLFLSSYYHGPMMLKLAADRPAVSVLWRGKSNNPERPDGLHTIMAAPVLRGGILYGVGQDGELRCAEAATGKQLWSTFEATGVESRDCVTAFLVPQGEGSRFVIFNDQGDLILADLSPRGYKQIDRAHILDPVQSARGRQVVWSHPAFAHRCVFARNDKEMVCVSLAATGG